MTTQFGVGRSINSSAEEAGREAARMALDNGGLDKADLTIIFTTSRHDPKKLRDGVVSVVGKSGLMTGGYAIGIITKDALSYGGYEVGVAAMKADDVNLDLFIERGIDESEYEVGKRLGAQVRGKKYSGQQGLFLMYDSVKRRTEGMAALNLATPLLKGMGESLGTWPEMAGIGLLGDMQFNPCFQFHNGEVLSSAAAALLFSGNIQMNTIIMHGCKPSGGYHTVTKADGNCVLEIDNKPALTMIEEMLGGLKMSWEEYPLFVTLGVNKGAKYEDFKEENYANRLCMAVDKERKGLVMFEPDLQPGMDIQLMRRSIDLDYIEKRADALFARLGDRKPLLALYVDCAGRAAAYSGTDEEEATRVQSAVGSRAPLLGMYSGVEVAKVGQEIQALDWTGVLSVLSQPA